MTQISEAFSAAGYTTPASAVRDLMREAIREGAGKRAESLASFQRRLPRSREVSIHLAYVGEEAQRAGAVRLYEEMLEEARHTYFHPPAPPARDDPENTRSGQEEVNAENGVHHRPTSPGTPIPPQNIPENTRSGQKTANAENGVHRDATAPGDARARIPLRKSRSAPPRPAYIPSDAVRRVSNGYLATIFINGIPLGQCTAGAARAWATTFGVRARFVLRMTSGLQDHMVIGHHRTEAEAATEFARAQEEQEDASRAA